MSIIKKSKLSELLTSIHTHAELASEENPEQIVYLEKDIIELLEKLKGNNSILNEAFAAVRHDG